MLVRYYGRLTLIGGLTAIIGPVFGGGLAAVTDWQGIFLMLAGVGSGHSPACAFGFCETLPAGRHSTRGLLRTSTGTAAKGLPR